MSQMALTRLVTASNRSARRRLAGVAAGVMVGVALFLLLIGASQGFEDRSLRSTWKDLAIADAVELTPETASLSDDQAAAAFLLDRFHGNTIQGIRVATTPDTSVRIPGSEVVPRPGEYLASPALAELIDAAPDGVLADRYGTCVGIIGHDGLEGPDSLVLVQGATVDELLASSGDVAPVVVTEFVGFDYSSQVYRTVAIIGAIAVLIPVLLLIAIVTDLGAAQRAERFASLRLVGASPQQVARIGAFETGITTAVGAIAGIGLYFAAIPLAALVRIGSSRFSPSDLFVSPAIIIGVVLLTILGATFVAWWRIRRAGIGPLGASREQLERRPRLLALLPLLAGLVLLGFAVALHRMEVGAGLAALTAVAGFSLTALGLLWAGPLLTWWVARLGGRSARSATQVIGFSRISRHPRSAFRAVAGMVIATFTVTVFAVAITGAAGVKDVPTGGGRLPTSTLVAPLQAGLDSQQIAADRDNIESSLGVTATGIASFTANGDLVMTSEDAAAMGIDLGGIDSRYVTVNPGYLVDDPVVVEPIDDVEPGTLTPSVLLVATDGSPDGIEHARTAMISSTDLSMYPSTRADNAAAMGLAMENQFATLAYIGILIAAALSTVSLAVSTIAALLNRKRIFGLLKLIGMPQQTLRGIVSWETAIPAITVLALSIGLGWFTGWSIISALTSRQIDWPSPNYYLVIAACLLLIVIATTATSRAARAMTANAVTRFE